MEVDASASDDLHVALDRIEAAVAGGSTDLRALGFWKVVARVKPDRLLVEEFAAQIGRIDTAAFRAGVSLRLPVWTGNLLLIGAIAVGGIAVWGAYVLDAPLWRGLALLAAAGIWSVGVHCPTHWVVGRAIGLRFSDYFLGGPPPPRPGLKTDYATYLRADPERRAWMHASGAIATKAAPFVVLGLWPGSGAPSWSAAGLLVLGIIQIVTDVTLSTKSSDWKKFARERAVARSRAT